MSKTTESKQKTHTGCIRLICYGRLSKLCRQISHMYRNKNKIQFVNSFYQLATSVYQGFSAMGTEIASTVEDTSFHRKIGTHDGRFHCDEVLACYMLKLLDQYRNSKIVRTRDLNLLECCDIVVDVGGKYDPKTHRYDHHQRGFTETICSVRPDLISADSTIKLSSVGLIYAHFGVDVLEAILKQANMLRPDDDGIYHIYKYIYNTFIKELDAIDNGVPLTTSSNGTPYKICTDLSHRVDRLNPQWNEPSTGNYVTELQGERFEKAMEMAGTEFSSFVVHVLSTWWPARHIVQEAFIKRKFYHKTGEILVLEGHCPWQEHLYELEKTNQLEYTVKFVVFRGDTANNWRVQAVPIEAGSFICRVFLRESWRGLRKDELSQEAKIENCVFCHMTGFIGGNETRDGAVEMAVKSIADV